MPVSACFSTQSGDQRELRTAVGSIVSRSEPAPATVCATWLPLNNLLRRGYQFNTTTRVQAIHVLLWRGYPINYYYSDTSELLASTRLQVNYQPLRVDQSTTNYAESSSVQFLCLQTTTFHLWNQLAYRKHSLLQL